MANKFIPRATVDGDAAVRIVRPQISRAVDRIRDAAIAGAPDGKVWVTANDERVRHTHRETNGQAIPANIPFKVPNVHGTGNDLAMHPRDPNLPVANRINCRCGDPVIASLVADTIHSTPATVAGTKVSGRISTNFPRAAESEFADDGGKWMRNALATEKQRWV